MLRLKTNFRAQVFVYLFVKKGVENHSGFITAISKKAKYQRFRFFYQHKNENID